eukprot:3937327-Rhodomonas_salina.2
MTVLSQRTWRDPFRSSKSAWIGSVHSDHLAFSAMPVSGTMPDSHPFRTSTLAWIGASFVGLAANPILVSAPTQRCTWLANPPSQHASTTIFSSAQSNLSIDPAELWSHTGHTMRSTPASFHPWFSDPATARFDATSQPTPPATSFLSGRLPAFCLALLPTSGQALPTPL